MAALTGKDWGQLLGMLVVLLTLGLLWTVTALVGRYFANKEKTTKAKAAVAAAANTPAKPTTSNTMSQASSPSDIPPGVLAAISAAVHVALGGRKARVVRVMPQRSDWGRFGRQQIFGSHKIR
ncbi:MAG: OadG family transporter subunit [Verrucomicrobiota bacterium]